MKKLFKRFIGFSMVLAMLILSTTSAFAASIQTTNENLDTIFTEDLKEREQEGWKYISEHKDEILAEIEAYNDNTATPFNVSYGGFRYLDGDILITKSTSLNGATGHAGIIVGTKVLDIHPDNPGDNPTTMTLQTWFNRFPETIVVRYGIGTTIPNNAADYGDSFYISGEGADNTYSIASTITSLTKDYCSSLVWKCYHYGANFDFKIQESTTSGSTWVIPSFILPTDFITFRAHNNFTIVHSVDWDW